MKLDHSRVSTRRRARGATAIFAACAALVALPAAGSADVMTLGSDLKKDANMVEDHGADSAFWNVFIDGQPQTIPAGGQVTFIRVKGSVLEAPSGRPKPDPQFHFQVIRPQGRGVVKVILSSAPFRLPIGGDPNEISGYKPVNLCVNRGDYVDFNDIGGFEWRWGNYSGMPVQVFSRTPDSTVNFYSKNNGTNIGSEWAPQETHVGQELLMQYKLATGRDASDICPGGYSQHIFSGLSVRNETISLSTKKRIVKMHAACPGKTYGACKGVLVLTGTLGGQPVTIGGTSFSVRPAYSASFELKLSRKMVKKIKRAGGVKANVTADGHDDPGHDRRADSDVPVQKRTTTGQIRIRPG